MEDSEDSEDSEASGQDRIRIMIHSAILRPESLRPSAPDPKPRKPRRCYITSCQPPGRTIHNPPPTTEKKNLSSSILSASDRCVRHNLYIYTTYILNKRLSFLRLKKINLYITLLLKSTCIFALGTHTKDKHQHL